MAIVRWDPFGEMVSLRDAMDHLLQDSFVRASGGQGGSGWFPMDVGESGEDITIRAYMPGVKPEDTHVSVHGDRLTIRAQWEERSEDGKSWQREYRAETCERSIQLPAAVDADKAQARYENGVLELTM